MTTQALSAFIHRLLPPACGLAALAAALEARTGRADLDPALQAQIDALLAALGGHGVLDGVSAPEATVFLNLIRHVLLCDHALMFAETRNVGWAYEDERLLEEVGEFARTHAHGIVRNVVPALDGLAERFAAADCAFLDIGVGVGGLAVELAELCPTLRIVGIDVWGPSLRLARQRVDATNLGDRIELREQSADHLEDESAFDLAWMPILFMPERVIPASLERTLSALRPGGWVVLPFANLAAEEPVASMWRLRTCAWGGPLWSTDHVEALLRNHGYADVRTLPSPPGVPVAMVVGRR
jgi:predicted O-methyltransferase YrrM